MTDEYDCSYDERYSLLDLLLSLLLFVIFLPVGLVMWLMARWQWRRQHKQGDGREGG